MCGAACSRVTKRKLAEVLIVEQFLRAAHVEASAVKESESPDFITEICGRRIGIEVTELFRDDRPPANESLGSRVIRQAQSLYEASGSTRPAHVTFRFDLELCTVRRDETAVALARFVETLHLQEWESANLLGREIGGVPRGIRLQRAVGLPFGHRNNWNFTRSAWVAPLTATQLQPIVDQKADKLRKYREKASENWLVIVAAPSQFLEVRDDFDPKSISSPFERTFFFSYPDQAIELGA